MDGSRRGFLAASAGTLAASVAGCFNSPPSVPSFEDAPGAGGGPTRYAYASEEGLVPERPSTLVARIDEATKHESHLSTDAFTLFANEPLSDAVSAAIDIGSVTAYAKVAGARAYVGVDTAGARDALAERGEERTAGDVTFYEGSDWAAAATENAVVEATAPLAGSTDIRREYVTAVVRARRGSGTRLVSAHAPMARVVGVLPACQYVILRPTVSDYDFESEAFGVSVRGEKSVLATARLASSGRDPSKRNARLNVLDRWEKHHSPDADVSNVTVVKRGRMVRVSGVLDTAKLTLDT